MTLNLSPQAEAKLFDAARQEGIDPIALLEKMVQAYHPATPPPAVYTVDNDPLMARLEARIAHAPTDPAMIQDAEDDLQEFMRRMNATRKETGATSKIPNASATEIEPTNSNREKPNMPVPTAAVKPDLVHDWITPRAF